MLKNDCYNAIRAKSYMRNLTSLYVFLILAIAMLISICFFPKNANAYFEYYDTFDSYATGTFASSSVPYWQGNGVISNNYSFSVPNSVWHWATDTFDTFVPNLADPFYFSLTTRFKTDYASEGGNGIYTRTSGGSSGLYGSFDYYGGVCNFNLFAGGLNIKTDNYSCNDWHILDLEVLYNENNEENIRARVDNGNWTDWTGYLYVLDNLKYIDITSAKSIYFDDWSFASEEQKSLTINAPVSESTASSTFVMDISYNANQEDFQKLMVIFESWNASSTCPVYGTSAWDTEYNNDWFYYQSIPYYSPTIATSGESSTTISVYNLDENNYNCVRCYFINEDYATLSEEACTSYTLNISGYIPQAQPLPKTNWTTYYAENTDTKFPTSTEIFTSIAGTFENLYIKITDFVNNFRTIFDTEQASTTGSSFGQKIPLARGYLKPINDFMSGFPVSELLIITILVSLIMIVYRIIKTILQLIRG